MAKFNHPRRWQARGYPDVQCAKYDLGDISFHNLSEQFKTKVLPKLQKMAKCAGNDGTYDHWSVPLDAYAGTSDNFTMSNGTITLKQDGDYMIHEVKTHFWEQAELVADDFGLRMGVGMDSVTDVMEVTKGGPTAEDFQYKDWKPKCKNSTDIDMLFERRAKFSKVPKFNIAWLFKKLIADTIKGASEIIV